MLLRKKALDKGLNVQLTKIKDISYPGKFLHCVAYRLLDQDQIKEKNAWKLFRTNEDWRMDIDGWTFDKSIAKEDVQDLETITETIARLPDDCVAVESNKVCTGIYDVLRKLQTR